MNRGNQLAFDAMLGEECPRFRALEGIAGAALGATLLTLLTTIVIPNADADADRLVPSMALVRCLSRL